MNTRPHPSTCIRVKLILSGLLFMLILLPAALLADTDDNMREIQNLSRLLQQTDRSIENIQRQIGESVIRNAGPAPEFNRLNEQLQDLITQKRDLIEEIQRLSSSENDGRRNRTPPVTPPDIPPDTRQNDRFPPQNGGDCVEDLSGIPSFEGIECR